VVSDAAVEEIDMTSPESQRPSRPAPPAPIHRDWNDGNDACDGLDGSSSSATRIAEQQRRLHDAVISMQPSLAVVAERFPANVEGSSIIHQTPPPPLPKQKEDQPAAVQQGGSTTLSLQVLELLAAQQAEAYNHKLREIAEHELRLQKWSDVLRTKEQHLEQWERRLQQEEHTGLSMVRPALGNGGLSMGSGYGAESGGLSFSERMRLAREAVVREGAPLGGSSYFE
jgi:hypothetical protein